MKKAYWISYDDKKINSIPLFSKSFELDDFIYKASLKITSMGFYYPIINFSKITDNFFMPGRTQYKKRVQVQKYDVSKFLKIGKNNIEILLGRGWCSAELFGWSKHPYIETPCFKCELEIILKSNKKIKIVSDNSWDIFTSKILYSDIYNGEIQDLNVNPQFLSKAKKVKVDVKEILQEGCDSKVYQIIYPRRLFNDNKGNIIIDFGQNFTGNIEINIIGKKNEILSFVPGEVLDKDGNFYNENYRKAKSFFKYILKDGINNAQPYFSFQGLRYLKLIDIPSNFNINSLKGLMITSSMKRTCYFDSGNEKINQLYHNIIYGQLSNYLDVPTDCPQRDERLGWLGDAQVFCKTACINFDVHDFYKKWLHDLIIDQNEDGSLEGACPKVPNHTIEISSGWADAATICPYEVYMAYGDKKLLNDCYKMMVKWVNYVKNTGDNPYLFNSGFHFGDWLGMDSPYQSLFGATDLFLVASAFYYHSIDLLIKAGKELNKNVNKYEDLLIKVKNEFRKTYLKDGLPIGKRALECSEPEKSTCFTQTAIALILKFNICLDEERKKLVDALVGLIQDNGNRMTTGFLGTPYLLHALSENGRSDVAYDLLLQEKKPSWLYSINKGATTIWEHWDGVNDEGKFWDPFMNSFNHYAYGSVFDWIYSSAGGINIIQPDYKEILIEPHPSKRLGHLDIKYLTKRGLLEIRWYYQDDSIIYNIEIPKDTIATVILNDNKYYLNEGKYMFSYYLKENQNEEN